VTGIIALAIAAVLRYAYLGPMFAVTQKLVEPRMRATAAALMLFVVNLIGYGGGPPVVGWMSDQGTKWQLERLDSTVSITECGPLESQLKAVRDGAPNAITGAELQSARDAVQNFCAPARKIGVRWGVTLGALFYLWAALHFVLMGRTMRKDLWVPDAIATTA
ncbi:MAG: hypothetical protein AAFS13_08785, partial [Pseudomonadota bacterium]